MRNIAPSRGGKTVRGDTSRMCMTSQLNSLPIGREVVVQQFSHMYFLEGCDDGWYIVGLFVSCCDFLVHPTSLTQFLFSRENAHKLSVTPSKKFGTGCRILANSQKAKTYKINATRRVTLNPRKRESITLARPPMTVKRPFNAQA